MARYGGFAAVGACVHIVLRIGLLKMAIYEHLYFIPYPPHRSAKAW